MTVDVNSPLFRDTQDCIVTLDQSGTVQAVNPAFINFFGEKGASLIGKAWLSVPSLVVDESPLDEWICPDLVKPFSIPVEMYNQSCDLLTLGWMVMADCTGFVLVGRDVTELRHMRTKVMETTSMLQTVMNNIPQFVFWKDTDLVYQGCNENFAEIAGLEHIRDIEGKTDFDMPWDKDQALFFRECDQRVIDSGEAELHIIEQQTQADGSNAWLDTNKIPMREADGEIIGVLGTFEDITESRRLMQQKAAAEAESRAKTDFMAQMSHEIRTPMNGILGMAELLSSKLKDPTHIYYNDIILSSGTALLTIINDILDYSKIEAGKMEIEQIPFSVTSLVAECVDIFKLKCSEKSIEMITYIDHRLDSEVIGDPARVKQVLTNLLGNATKFTDVGDVSISVLIHQDNLRFLVEDTGCGIKEDSKAKIFEVFTQADSAITRKYGGTGLGLSISKKLANLMGGGVSFESEVGKGSKFWMDIPLRKDETSTKRNIQKAKAPLSFLFLTRPQKAFLSLVKQIEERGHRVEIVATLDDAHKLLDSDGRSFDVICVDHGMRADAGLELINELSKKTESQMSQLIVLSQSNDENLERRLKRCADVEVIEKPYVVSRIMDLCVESDTSEEPEELDSALDANLEQAIGARILVAEDNKVNQIVIRGMLGRWGCKADIVDNGQICVDRIKEDSDYDLILMDCEMPVMNGYLATESIRAWEREAGIEPLNIVALTANAVRKKIDACYESGMDDVLLKPIDVDKLFNAIVTRTKSRTESRTNV